MMKNIIGRLSLFSIFFLCSIIQVYSSNTLTIEEFIKTTIENDATFEEILINGLSLKYIRDLKLPAGDLILSVKSQYEFILNRDKGNPRAAISLSKLFPYSGTSISAGYGSDSNTSELTLLISQPIAENAFGRTTILQDKIIGVEINLTEYQIIEAYEDYLANIMIIYYSWYSAYENLKIGKSSYGQSLELFDNIEERRKNNIALPIDVNKINVQVLTKKESLIGLEEKYENILNIVKQAVVTENEILIPVDPFMYNKREISFEDDYKKFAQTSRTYKLLNLLEEKSSLEVEKDADLLLPSTDILLGYTIEGENAGFENPDSLLFAGVSVTWPFPGKKEHAEYEISKIERRKTLVSNKNKYVQLYTNLKNLFIRIEREKKLISIAQEKIALAEAILKDETKNYTYGKVSLNDFIEAVNRVDENKFNKIQHSVQLKILATEWIRMTDQLVLKKDVRNIQK